MESTGAPTADARTRAPTGHRCSRLSSFAVVVGDDRPCRRRRRNNGIASRPVTSAAGCSPAPARRASSGSEDFGSRPDRRRVSQPWSPTVPGRDAVPELRDLLRRVGQRVPRARQRYSHAGSRRAPGLRRARPAPRSSSTGTSSPTKGGQRRLQRFRRHAVVEGVAATGCPAAHSAGLAPVLPRLQPPDRLPAVLFPCARRRLQRRLRRRRRRRHQRRFRPC